MDLTPMLIGGDWRPAVGTGQTEDVTSPYDGSVVGTVPMAGSDARSGVRSRLNQVPDVGLQVRICRGDTDPAHFSLLLHLLQGRDQVSVLTLLDAGVVQLHHIDVVGSHPLEALV